MQRRDFLAGSAAVGGLTMTTDLMAKPNAPRFFDVPDTPRLHMRHRARKGGQPVLYIHGATFPSASSVGYRFADGKSWEDDLHAHGFDVWALDFEGFGGSARPAVFDQPADTNAIPLRSQEAAQQIARAVEFVLAQTRRQRVSMIAHSWGGVPAARYAVDHADKLDRLVLFAPVLSRPKPAVPQAMGNNLPNPTNIPAWRRLTIAEQLARFVNDTPKGRASVLAEPTLDRWGPKWLATDASASSHNPPAVQVPTGPQADIMAMWSGGDLYDPAAIATPTLIVRGAWDSVCSAADADRLKSRMKPRLLTSVTIPDSGHLAHIETNRALLWATTRDYLKGKPR
jgi:pimeloyl-ACP methyl ester carboxylesterase